MHSIDVLFMRPEQLAYTYFKLILIHADVLALRIVGLRFPPWHEQMFVFAQ